MKSGLALLWIMLAGWVLVLLAGCTVVRTSGLTVFAVGKARVREVACVAPAPVPEPGLDRGQGGYLEAGEPAGRCYEVETASLSEQAAAPLIETGRAAGAMLRALLPGAVQ